LPTAKEHREQAEHNEFFVSELENPFWDWAVTGTFYAALHYVQGFLILSGRDPDKHSDRNFIIQNDPILSKIWLEYRQLYNDSKLARYKIQKFTQEDVRLLRDNDFKTVKDYLVPMLPK
jgi:uncharacterized protein (UPF0332 family)